VIPLVPTWRLEGLPRHLEWEEVERLLATCDRARPSGRRTYALLQLVATYGARIGQVTTLRLGDIDWAARRITFQASKHGKPVTFGLTATVAEALLSYLKDRGPSSYPEVFLTVCGPRRPLSESNHFGTCLIPCFRRAGIIGRPYGAHAIRHAVASRLVNQGTPIKAIADILGHRSIDTTRIYAKLDLTHLRKLAVEWPEPTRTVVPPGETIL
jgi:integrase